MFRDFFVNRNWGTPGEGRMSVPLPVKGED